MLKKLGLNGSFAINDTVGIQYTTNAFKMYSFQLNKYVQIIGYTKAHYCVW
jgi:hypothetical protein